jgi:hypothetical protein
VHSLDLVGFVTFGIGMMFDCFQCAGMKLSLKLVLKVRCDCDLIVLGLASRLIDDWPPVLEVTIIGCFPNLYQMTHSIKLLLPLDHVVQLVELLTLGYFVFNTRCHPCLVVFKLRCFFLLSYRMSKRACVRVSSCHSIRY